MPNKNLLEELIKEVDSWQVEIKVNNNLVSYNHLIKPILCGICIDLARQEQERLSQRSLNNYSSSLYELPLADAIKKLEEKVIRNRYVVSGFDGKRLAEELGYTYGGLRQILHAHKISLREIKEDYYRKKGIIEEKIEEGPEHLEKRILEYNGLRSPVLNKFLKAYNRFIANRINKIVNSSFTPELKGSTLSEIKEDFVITYVGLHQKMGLNLKKVAEVSKVNYGALRARLFRLGRGKRNDS
ncbi:hypothetical protein HZC32_02120 [Candidatus Woesearchaeota archaeon]|nr:hypothetical protein [Candidatus Woesearchaeota archaeon]